MRVSNGYIGYSVHTQSQRNTQTNSRTSSSGSSNSNLVFDTTLRRDEEIYKYYNSEEAKRKSGQGTPIGTYDPAEVDRLSDIYVEAWLKGDMTVGRKPADGTPRSWNEVAAEFKAREKILVPRTKQQMDNVLKENGIEINEDEKFDIVVENGQIVVNGENMEKAKQIEEVLNNAERMGVKLHYITKQKSSEFINLGDQERDVVFSKMSIDYRLARESNGEISLSDLKMENGKLVGLTPELEALYYGTQEGMTTQDIDARIYQRKAIEKILNYGLENIKDMVTKLVYTKDGLSFIG